MILKCVYSEKQLRIEYFRVSAKSGDGISEGFD
jgi:hypothetical protein